MAVAMLRRIENVDNSIILYILIYDSISSARDGKTRDRRNSFDLRKIFSAYTYLEFRKGAHGEDFLKIDRKILLKQTLRTKGMATGRQNLRYE